MSKTPKPEWSRFAELVHAGGGQWLTRGYHHLGAMGAFVASRLGLSPNVVTLVSALCVLVAVCILGYTGLGTLWASVVVFVLMAVGYVLDCADGQLARATQQCSKLGAWLDHLVDAGKIFLVNFCIGWVLISRPEVHGLEVSLCFVAMVLNITGSALYFFAWNFKVLIAGDGLIERMSDKKSQGKVRLLKLSHQVTDYGWFPFIFLVMVDPGKFAMVYLVYGAITFLIFMGYIVLSAGYMAKLKD
ncbi:CDP-alcohol phosphatidyltransferase [Rubritalea squalenifaciens DSM 18772]|uniref:CDP-alcohol phosphatidyltransferase n=1 Tax=Rubritalea squalenifaciens DSM 18772 TaxID=1123071 RepID=A0A1M6DIB9_9BACT|nr:CDP-alcohol phosphatidyltransferase family protein [Rubritalea squalenifaciens]SHI73006.1 CDP-alcohol phosphatidyltransferase [Rubritalea squalenifaciens DSM 18772]